MALKKEVIDGREYVAVSVPMMCRDGQIRMMEPLVPVEQVDEKGNLKAANISQ